MKKSLLTTSTSRAPGAPVTSRRSRFQPCELGSIGGDSRGAVQSQASSGRRVLVTVRADATGTIEVRTKLPMSLSGEATLWAYGRESKRGFRQTLTLSELPATGSVALSRNVALVAMLLGSGFALVGVRRRLNR